MASWHRLIAVEETGQDVVLTVDSIRLLRIQLRTRWYRRRIFMSDCFRSFGFNMACQNPIWFLGLVLDTQHSMRLSRTLITAWTLLKPEDAALDSRRRLNVETRQSRRQLDHAAVDISIDPRLRVLVSSCTCTLASSLA